MKQPFTKPARNQHIDPLPSSELQRLSVQADLLRRAEEGNEEALALVRAKLVRWERKGRRIV